MAFGEGLLRKAGIHATHDRKLVVAQVPDVVVTATQSVDRLVHLGRLPIFRRRRVDVTSRTKPSHFIVVDGVPSSSVAVEDSSFKT
jgi:hypothetical protein